MTSAQITSEEAVEGVDQKEATAKNCSLVIFGIPQADSSRMDKLKSGLEKLFIKHSSEFQADYPLQEDGSTKGYCFVKFESEEIAKRALITLDNAEFGKHHTLTALPFIAFDLPKKEFAEPGRLEHFDVGDLWSWMQNAKCLDQFALQFSGLNKGETIMGVYWNGHGCKDPSLASDMRTNWTEGVFEWSSYGTYLATTHSRGVILWGGPEFQRVKRMHHTGVSRIMFSPQERFLITYSACCEEDALRVFDTITGERKKSFSLTDVVDFASADWPIKCSFDDKYFAFCRPNKRSMDVYESDNFTLRNDGKPIELEGLKLFEWNPARNLLAYFCEEVGGTSYSSIGIIELPSVVYLRTQPILASVAAAKLYWHNSGRYLAIYTDRYQGVGKTRNKETKEVVKTKKRNIAWHLDFFDCSRGKISSDTVISMLLPDPLVDFAWEPSGNKFCILMGKDNEVAPHIYQLEEGKQAPSLLSKINAGSVTNALWAPQGGWLCAYGPSVASFIDACGSGAVLIREVKHDRMNAASWDPTGRYFVTCSLGLEGVGVAYWIHSFLGRELHREHCRGVLLKFKWRPRPPVFLDEHRVEKISRNMQSMSVKFDNDDEEERKEAFKELITHRRETMEIFKEIGENSRLLYEEERDERVKLRDGVDSDGNSEAIMVDETIPVPLQTETEECVLEGNC